MCLYSLSCYCRIIKYFRCSWIFVWAWYWLNHPCHSNPSCLYAGVASDTMIFDIGNRDWVFLIKDVIWWTVRWRQKFYVICEWVKDNYVWGNILFVTIDLLHIILNCISSYFVSLAVAPFLGLIYLMFEVPKSNIPGSWMKVNFPENLENYRKGIWWPLKIWDLRFSRPPRDENIYLVFGNKSPFHLKFHVFHSVEYYKTGNATNNLDCFPIMYVSALFFCCFQITSIPILMHWMRISENNSSSAVLDIKKFGKSNL